MEIRFACEQDIPRILDLLDQVGEVHHQLRPDIFRAGARKYDEAALSRLLKDPSRPIFGAFLDGTLVGYAFCILEFTEDGPVLKERRVLYIDDLCVDEACRGRGIAGALYAQVCAHARSLGCDAVELNVWCGNDSAMGFYEKCGLKPRNIRMEFLLEEETC